MLLAIRKTIHKTIQNVTEDLDKFHFNKAVARIRELTNALEEIKVYNEQAAFVFSEGINAVIKLLQPMVPHIAEELWAVLGNKEMLVNSAWPVAEASLIVDDTIVVAVQLNGKLKVAIEMPKNVGKEEMERLALANGKVRLSLEGKQVKKIIVVPGRIVNVVI